MTLGTDLLLMTESNYQPVFPRFAQTFLPELEGDSELLIFDVDNFS